RENAIEGCVRETFGALVATWQAANARDPRIARALRVIARDETRHASLAWRVQRFYAAKLSSTDHAKTRAALRGAARALQRELSEPHADLVVHAGTPTLAEQQRLFTALAAELWST